MLHRVLDRLSPRDRLVVTLLYLENHSVADTASLTGWSQAMVKVQAFRARSKLRKLLERTI
jgi:RNA polymerase sigma-70 factor (ECF subfamily)